MKEYKKITKEVEVLDKFICDICGKDMTCCESKPLDDNDKEIKDYFKTNDRNIFEGGNFKFDFGCGSKRDWSYYKGEICDDCFDKYFSKLLIKSKHSC